MSGDMQIILKEAIFERDTATFFEMEPHYVITWKDDEIKGEKCYGGGTTPKWNATHSLHVGKDLSSMGIIMFAFMSGDNIVCQTVLQVSTLIKTKGIDLWHHCRYKGKNSGQFCMRIEYDGEPEGEPAENIVPENKDPVPAPTMQPVQYSEITPQHPMMIAPPQNFYQPSYQVQQMGYIPQQ